MSILVLFSVIWTTPRAYAQNCTPTISAQSGASLCNGGTVLLEASSAATYEWSTGATTPTITVSEAGTYWVKTISADGCEGTSEEFVVAGKPDASITNPVYNFVYCSYSGNAATFKLVVNNTSKTKDTNQRYTINWGDGSTDSYDNSFETTTHTYTSGGTYTLQLTVTGENGCTSTKTENVFIGSNPGLGISSEGSSTSCAPATFDFKITGVEGNSPYTIYTFQFDDGSAPIVYTHAQLPKDRIIRHTFTESSQGKQYGFTLTGIAENPCSSSKATFEGIRISKGPKADFSVSSKTGVCAVLEPENAMVCGPQ